MSLIDERLAPVTPPEPALQAETGPELAFWFDPEAANATEVALALRNALRHLPNDTELPVRQVESARAFTHDIVDASITAHKGSIATQIGELIEDQPWFAHRPLPRASVVARDLDEDGLERTGGMLPPDRGLIDAANERAQKIASGEIEEVLPETGSEFRRRVHVEALLAEMLRPCAMDEARVIMYSLMQEALDRSEEEPDRIVATRVLVAIERTVYNSDERVLHVDF